MLQTGKYNVFKVNPDHPAAIGEKLGERTCFLLRDQDALATMTLRSYVANALQILDWGRDPTTGLTLTEEQREELMARADGAAELADQWAKLPHKIPD